MEIQNSGVALLVHSCDRYEFLYQGFGIFFAKNWDRSIPSAYYFATEEKTTQVPGFTTIQSGKGEWSDRLAFLLRNRIKEKYVLYFQEDMWLNKPVNKNFFETLFKLADTHNWQQVKLHSSEVYKTIPTQYLADGFVIAKLDNTASDFLMSHQVTLWNREFLLAQLAKNEHPWRNERKATKRLKALDPEIFQADYFSENGKPEINANPNPVDRSEYQTISVNGMLGDNIQPYINELMQGNEAEKAYAHELEYHHTNKLTHDGKPKPRKEDLFKRIKRFLRNR